MTTLARPLPLCLAASLLACVDPAPRGDATPPDAAPPPDVVTPDVVAPDVVAPDLAPPDAPPDAATPDASPDVATPDASPDVAPVAAAIPAGTILFVTQVPNGSYTSVARTFGNHLGDMASAPRGGSLMLRYPDGTLRDLTREAGYGNAGMQGEMSAAVREPCVHWDGRRALFAMVTGAPRRYEVRRFTWQIYEVSGLAPGERARVERVAGQPAGYNNVSPVYGADDAVIFTSDRPRGGEAHHYPQLDEYESTPSTSGLWRLDPATGALSQLVHAPSGAFTPTVDSAGRVVFTQWDHLQRDQQADATRYGDASYGAMTYRDEGADAPRSAELAGAEVFPEPRTRRDPDLAANASPHTFNHFFPWQVMQDGTGAETLNHVGRQELGGAYTEGSFTDDPNLSYHTSESLHANRLRIRGDGGLLQLREDPRAPGVFVGTYALEFATDGAGMLIRLEGARGANPDAMRLTAVTHPQTYSTDATHPAASGHYRNPLPLADGTLLAAHTTASGTDTNLGTSAAPRWAYNFRLKTLRLAGEHYVADAALTPGLTASVQWYDPDQLVSWSGTLWELDPVEVRPRPRPPSPTEELPAVERAVFADERVDVAAMRAWLRRHDLALVVSRDVTQRDRGDVQQPYNLRVPGGAQSIARPGRVYEVPFFQVFQADALRGYGGVTSPRPGRRLLARPMHAAALPNVAAAGAPPGAVGVARDGSVAAFVPAGRALSWQLTDARGAGVVRERNWVSLQPGEIRACPTCHAVNTASQTMAATPTHAPEALRALLRAWRAAM